MPGVERDVLLVGTPNNLQCYDVERNRDLFFKDITDGINCTVTGQFGSYTKPLAIVGGNCSVQVCFERCVSSWAACGSYQHAS